MATHLGPEEAPDPTLGLPGPSSRPTPSASCLVSLPLPPAPSHLSGTVPITQRVRTSGAHVQVLLSAGRPSTHHTHTLKRTRTRAHTHTNTCTFRCTHTYTHVHTCALPCSYSHAQVLTQSQARTHTHRGELAQHARLRIPGAWVSGPRRQGCLSPANWAGHLGRQRLRPEPAEPRAGPSAPLACRPHRLISDLQTSSKLYSLARVGWKVTCSCSVSSGRIVPKPSLGWMSTNWQTENR